MTEIKNRYDFVLLFDVKDGNPNGDPDAGNLPRVDPETGHGLVTDVCLKRKVRNYVQLTRPDTAGYDIFVKEKAVLNRAIKAAVDEVRGEEKGEKVKKGTKASDGVEDGARSKLCAKFFDIRTFGAVLSTGEKGDGAGQVRGPVQLTFSRSIDPIVTLEHSITRMAVTNEKDVDKERTMGRKNTVPYGLYRGFGFVSPQLARQTSFSGEDLELLWKAFQEMFEHDRSAARGLMSLQRVIRFRHGSDLGNAPAHRLFERVQVTRKDPAKPARDFSDYAVTVDRSGLPEGIEVDEFPR